MAEESAEALQWFRERLEQLGEQYPELRTVGSQDRLSQQLTAEERLTLGVRALLETYNGAQTGVVPPIHQREYLLVLALERIATGEVESREARAYAVQVLTMWLEYYRAREKNGHGGRNGK